MFVLPLMEKHVRENHVVFDLESKISKFPTLPGVIVIDKDKKQVLAVDRGYGFEIPPVELSEESLEFLTTNPRG